MPTKHEKCHKTQQNTLQNSKMSLKIKIILNPPIKSVQAFHDFKSFLTITRRKYRKTHQNTDQNFKYNVKFKKK